MAYHKIQPNHAILDSIRHYTRVSNISLIPPPPHEIKFTRSISDCSRAILATKLGHTDNPSEKAYYTLEVGANKKSPRAKHCTQTNKQLRGDFEALNGPSCGAVFTP